MKRAIGQMYISRDEHPEIGANIIVKWLKVRIAQDKQAYLDEDVIRAAERAGMSAQDYLEQVLRDYLNDVPYR